MAGDSTRARRYLGRRQLKTTLKWEDKMLQAHSTLRALSRKFFERTVLATAIGAALLSVGNAAGAEKVKNDRAARLLATIRVPTITANNTTAGAFYSFDISWVDQPNRLYFVADRSNKVVDVVDTTSNILVEQLAPGTGFAPFAGVSPPAFSTGTAGPNGVTTLGQCLFVTDAPSRVVSFNFVTGATVSSVNTDPSEPTRADELAVDPKDSLILAINNAATPPFGTFIKFDPTTCKLTPPSPATDRITFASPTVNATNGAEQPMWDPVTQKFYLSIPQVGAALESGAVVRIDPTTKKIDGTFGVMFCQPAGLTKGPNNDALLGCSIVFDTNGGQWSATDAFTAAPIQVILNLKTGDVDPVAGVGVSDEVWFNSGDGNYYTASQRSPLGAVTNGGQTQVASSASILGVIDANDEELLQLVPTYSVTSMTTGPASGLHPAGSAHSVAVDAKNNHIFVPLAANNVFPNCLTGCIAVYWHGDEDEPGQVVLP
jgi:hypothetical protein